MALKPSTPGPDLGDKDRQPSGQDAASITSARRLLWVALALDALAFGAGLYWDNQWHKTNRFDDFFSPPHLFIYATHLVATIAFAALTFRSDLRRWFGQAFRLWPFPFVVPGVLALAGAGFALIGLAGVLDAIWHTAFGLDETNWSLPHSLFKWAVYLEFIGLAACRLALAQRLPITWPAAVVLGFLLFALPCEPLGGPLFDNVGPATVREIATFPALARSAPFQHTTRLYLLWGLSRESPLFAPVISVAVGLGLGLLYRYERRLLVILAVAAVVTAGSQTGPTPWVVIPVILPALVVALRGRRLRNVEWLIAGVLFGTATAVIWGVVVPGELHDSAPRPELLLLGALASGPLMAFGAAGADRVWQVLAAPTRRGVVVVATALGVAAPIACGVVDLWLRFHTP